MASVISLYMSIDLLRDAVAVASLSWSALCKCFSIFSEAISMQEIDRTLVVFPFGRWVLECIFNIGTVTLAVQVGSSPSKCPLIVIVTVPLQDYLGKLGKGWSIIRGC